MVIYYKDYLQKIKEDIKYTTNKKEMEKLGRRIDKLTFWSINEIAKKIGL